MGRVWPPQLSRVSSDQLVLVAAGIMSCVPGKTVCLEAATITIERGG